MMDNREVSQKLDGERKRILLIDDEYENGEFFKNALKDHEVLVTCDGHTGLALSRLVTPDLIILNHKLQGNTGLAISKCIRSQQGTELIPLIFIMDTDSESLRADAFHAGADDVILKPFLIKEVYSRIQARLHFAATRGPEPKQDVLMCGNLIFDTQRWEVRINGEVVHLTYLESQILKFFIENREKMIMREHLIDALWKGCSVTHRTVDTHVSAIRRKLSAFNHAFRAIHGAGYRLLPKD